MFTRGQTQICDVVTLAPLSEVQRVDGLDENVTDDKLKKDYILIQYKGNDKLYLPVEDISKLYKYVSKEGMKPTINKLNSIEWTKTKLRIREKIKDITQDLLKIYKEREKAIIKPFSKDDENQMLFDSEFVYTETADQLNAINLIKFFTIV